MTAQVRRLSEAVRILLDAQEGSRPVSPETLAAYREQLARVDRDRERMEHRIAMMWQMIGRGETH